MEAAPSELSDWAHLPGTAVQLISQKLKLVTDYVRFRAVCSPWRSASVPKPRHLPPQLPWLLIPWDSRDTEDDGIRLFYDLWESKMRKLHLPETIGMVCWSSNNGWLFLSDAQNEEILLLNPLTRARIRFPLFAQLRVRVGFRGHSGDPHYHDFWRHPCLGDLEFGIRKVTSSADPTNPDCLITVFPWRCHALFCCRVRDHCWTPIKISPSMDATYYNGRFYLLYDNVMVIIDSDNPQDSEERIFPWLEPNLIADKKFLIEGKSAVYAVHVVLEDEPAADYLEENTVGCLRKKTELYKFQEQLLKLEKVTDTGSQIIFCGRDTCPYLAVCSDDWEFLDGGCVYIVVRALDESHYSICMAKLDDFELKSVVSNLGKGSQNYSSARPMWFQPSPF
ncbi:F-box protein skip23 [Rhynchospora pubera]|uniref:F-box protein skip23 n=1 Tax=Rhynchospora pubera TaxID=906938 RepID=A0AAV8CTZ1_9POAL|nr:F-box protein skip23 [Rhynchospora pubera]